MVVLSTIQSDQTSSDVMEWMVGEHVKRINNDEISTEFLNLNVYVSEKCPPIKSVWFRKTTYHKIAAGESDNPEIIKYATDELYALTRLFYSSPARQLGNTDFISLSKLPLLAAFMQAGLQIPPTVITTQKEILMSFVNTHKNVILKPFGECKGFNHDGSYYKIYTEKVDEILLNNLGETFFPTLLQKQIDKECEVRSFYLDGRIFSMAIIAPSNSEADHRIHLQNGQTLRNVPFQLPVKIEESIRNLMMTLKLNTGSFDILKGKDGEFYFLELNPEGQIKGLSYNCNYYLERAIANYLKSND